MIPQHRRRDNLLVVARASLHPFRTNAWLKGAPVTAADVSEIIANEIASVGENWLRQSQNNPHSLDLSRCLIKPERITCKNTFPKFRGGKPFEAWLVLEELPSSEDGYRIIFDEEVRKFGLACGTKREPVFIGWHGSFLNTVRGM